MKALIALLLIVSFENARAAEDGKFKENYFSTTNKNRIFGRIGYGTEPEVTGGSRAFEIRPGSYQRKDEPEADKSSE